MTTTISPTHPQGGLRLDADTAHMSANTHAGAFLAADISGTRARLGLVAPRVKQGRPEILAYRTYRCGDHPHLEDIVRCFCRELDVQPRELVLACAGYVHAGTVINKDLVWPVLPQIMKKSLGLDRVTFLNDLQALAYAVGRDAAPHSTLLKPAKVSTAEDGPVVVLGPGTGLGAAVWLPGQTPRVMATEAGHIQLAARVGIEQQVVMQLAQADSHVSCETVLSSPGLYRIYNALCAIRDRYPSLHEPADVTAAALADKDDVAGEALGLFCGWLGSFAADLAMLYGATGGIYIAGGFLSRIPRFVEASTFLQRFLDKGVVRPFLETVPVHLVDHAQLGVVGAASWLMDRQAKESSV
jgi:glucokinase